MSMTATKRAREAPIRVRAHRKSEASFRALVETLGAPVFVSCGERFHDVNHAAEAITGYTRAELLSMDFCDLLDPDAQEAVIARAGAHQGQTGWASRREVRIPAKHQDQCWLEVMAATIDFHGVPAKQCSAFDLTKRKRAESQARLLPITEQASSLSEFAIGFGGKESALRRRHEASHSQ